MSTKSPTRSRPAAGRRTSANDAKSRRAQAAAAEESRKRRRELLLWGAVLTAVAALIAAMMWSARETSDTTARPAPDFTLTDTSGATVKLADFRGKNVVLYFNEGAGCQSCILQMADIERNAAAFTAADITVLPIVMNSAEQIKADMARNGVRTPFLLDDGTVSAAYGTLGKGMHEGLPGHSFVLIDAQGTQRWYGEYPSMYLSSADLLDQVREHLP
ncbi:peroxiredoxin family protein [Actinophytocola sp.]|uniref:peroxiredoxin family protein n=1 Tax=Actinophytocola sp. TaxID=1872138 RepID=UPI002D7F4397|nr:redoxin domain-containing protein [Actinophytocola sp.]HET9139288.1 redoxin domain-containing protein [Actinophytocola sp.]